jgi:predicted XRE-type DNA-binding protein
VTRKAIVSVGGSKADNSAFPISAPGRGLCATLLSKEGAEDEPQGHSIGSEAIQCGSAPRRDNVKIKRRRSTEHGPRATTPAGRGVMRELVAEEEAVELEIRSALLRGLEQWLAESDMTQMAAAKILRVTQARVSDIKRGKVSQFSIDTLVRLAARAGLRPTVRLAARHCASRADLSADRHLG